MKIEKMIEEAKKLDSSFPREAMKKMPEPSLVNVLLEIENTIRTVSALYTKATEEADKRKELKRIITEAETRAMSILVILRNRK